MSGVAVFLAKFSKPDGIAKNARYWLKRKTMQRDALHMASFRANGAKGRCAKYTNIKSTIRNARTL